jgi:Arc/MetJ-type ribon-helix-helix transcriptional regulator
MRLRVLRDALTDGEHSGESAPFDFNAFLARKRTAKYRPVGTSNG